MPKDRSPRRRPEPKTQKPGPTHRAGRLHLLLYGLPLVLVALLTYGALRSPYLTVQNVKVKGTETLDSASLVELSGLQGKSMLRLPTAQAASTLLELPQVKAVSFTRTWPQGVTMKVQEREPVAFWSVGGRDYSVDAEGVVLAAGAPSGPAPRIVEAESTRLMGPGDRVHPDAVALARRIFDESPRFLNQTVDRLEYTPAIGVTAVFSNGMRVTFGDERAWDYKVAVLTKLLDRLTAQNIKPRAVDLRYGERVTYE